MKTLVLSIALVMLLQLRFGEESIEDKIGRVYDQSRASIFLQQVAEGAVTISKDVSKKVSSTLAQSLSSGPISDDKMRASR